MKYIEIRQKYLEFMKSKGHQEIPNAPLVPENDPSVLFVNAGMFPLVPFLMGEKHPDGTRLTNVQRCVRTGDIDDVGDAGHCTAFEMLGNWSLNDYFKKEAINFTVDFFVDVLGLDINKIYGSVFKGVDGVPRDEESIQIWKALFAKRGIEAKVGIGERIQEFGKKENWWGLAGGGPCGPCSEIFYDTGKEACGSECNINCNCGKYLEIGNNVLMQYLSENNELKPLGRHNIDFGGGLERITAMLQGVESYYDTDIYKPITDKVRALSTIENIKSQRIIVDHIKSATWIVMDGVTPGRTEQGYILRRLIRRAVRHAKTLGFEGKFTKEVADICIDQFAPIYPKLKTNQAQITEIIEQEEIKFGNTLKDGIKRVEKLLEGKTQFNNENGESFSIYETYGFPPELFLEEIQARDIKCDLEKFWSNHNNAMSVHQDKSRTASQGLFKGGLADTSQMSTRYHTAQHLILASMRKIVGDHIYQKGSNITPERLRFDFPSQDKLTDEQLSQIEKMVNDVVDKGLVVSFEEMPKTEALKLVPFAAFEEKYGDSVKVYFVGPRDNFFSAEICNGPHVTNTKEIGHIKIMKQENLGAGLKRIKAVIQE